MAEAASVVGRGSGQLAGAARSCGGLADRESSGMSGVKDRPVARGRRFAVPPAGGAFRVQHPRQHQLPGLALESGVSDREDDTE